MATGIGSLVVNLSANIAKFHSDMKQAAAVTQESMGKIEKAVSGASKAFGALLGAGAGFAVGRMFREAISEVDRFQVSLVSAAATMADMVSKKGTGMAVGDIYAASLEHSKKMYEQLDLAAAKHFASGKELQAGYNMFLQKGVVLREQDIHSLGVVVDKIKLLTQGQSSNLQIMQEIRSLNDGQARAGSALASLLKDELGKNWADIVEQHRQAGDLLQWMASLFPGLDAATKDIENTLEAQKETLTTMIAKVGREGLGQAYEDIVNIVKDINTWLVSHGNELSGAIKTGWTTIKALATEVKGIIEVISYIAQKGIIVPITFIIKGLQWALPSGSPCATGMPDLPAGAKKFLQDPFEGYETPGEGLRKPWGKLPEGAFKPGGLGGGGGGGRRGGGGAKKAIDEVKDIYKEMEEEWQDIWELIKATHQVSRDTDKLLKPMRQSGFDRLLERNWTAKDFEAIEGGIEKGSRKIWTPTGAKAGKDEMKELWGNVGDFITDSLSSGIQGVLSHDKNNLKKIGQTMFQGFLGEMTKRNVKTVMEKLGGWIGIGKDEKDSRMSASDMQSSSSGVGQMKTAAAGLQNVAQMFTSNAVQFGVAAAGLILSGIGIATNSEALVIAGMVLQAVAMVIQVVQTLTATSASAALTTAAAALGVAATMLMAAAAANAIPFFHTGGIITAHSGYLAPDETLIKAQSGERVLSRSQNREWEGRHSMGGNSPTINIFPRYPMGRMETEYMVRTRLIPALSKHEARYGGSSG